MPIKKLIEAEAAPIPPVKDCIARLLDLTAGWAYFAANEEGEYANAAYAGQVYELYQAVGAELAAVADSEETVKQAAVIKFVGQQLLPVLLGAMPATPSFTEPIRPFRPPSL